jgi:hypothetical protein
MTLNRVTAALVLWLAASLGTSSAVAATFCVSNGTELQAALSTAASNGEDDLIRLRTGTFRRSAAGIAFTYFTAQNHSLTLEGGWFGVTVGNCAIRLNTPTSTVLDGEGLRSVAQLLGDAGTSGALSVRNLSVINGMGTDVGGLAIGVIGNFVGDVSIERVIFRDNQSPLAGALSAAADGGVLRVSNNLFDGNRCGGAGCAASLVVNTPLQNAPQPRLTFVGNTVVRHACLGAPCSQGAVRLGGGFGGPAQFLLAGNVLALNAQPDIQFSLNTGTLRNSRWDNLVGSPTQLLANLAPGSAPGFVDAGAGDFRLAQASALVDAGFATPQLPSLDLAGQPRSAGAAPDIVAFELQPPLFQNGFEGATVP